MSTESGNSPRVAIAILNYNGREVTAECLDSLAEIDYSGHEVVVVDIGAEYGMYTADVTRTIPISGKFTDRQRRIYEIVLRANEAGIAMVFTGMRHFRH